MTTPDLTPAELLAEHDPTRYPRPIVVGTRLHLSYDPGYADTPEIDVTVETVFDTGDLDVVDGTGHGWTLLRYEVDHRLVTVTVQ